MHDFVSSAALQLQIVIDRKLKGASPCMSQDVMNARGERAPSRGAGTKLSSVATRVSSTDFRTGAPAASMTNHPFSRINPGAGCDSPRECPRSQLVGDLCLDIAHLFATNWKALFDCLSLGAFLGNLPNDGCGQEFLIRAQRQHVMLSDRVQQPATLWSPAATRESAYRNVRRPKQMAAESRLEIAGRPGPISGQPIDEQILNSMLAYLDRVSARII